VPIACEISAFALTGELAVLVTGQLADDLSAVIKDLETLFGTLNEDNLKLQ